MEVLDAELEQKRTDLPCGEGQTEGATWSATLQQELIQ